MNLDLFETGSPVVELVGALSAKARNAGQLRAVSVAKGARLFDQGAQIETVFMLQSGLVKLVYETVDGDEWIKSLIADCGLFGPSNSDEGKAIAYSARAIEPCTLGQVPLNWIIQTFSTSPDMVMAYAGFVNWVRHRKETREAALLCQSAEERYRDLLANSSSLLARLPQADIARYLRVTPIAFSRIKRRIRT